LAGYYALALAYSLRLKRQMMIDVVALTSLYGIRLAAGSVAMMVPMSQWLMALSFFLFLCLALVKRCTELIDRAQAGTAEAAGRAYRNEDLSILEAMAAASGYVAVLVLALYINSPAVAVLYRRPQILWLICVVLIYWISRILLLTRRGEMHDDPVIFAVTDRVSLACGTLVAVLMAAGI
jgi:4-hydroxybenzoate polyprenyltransferase